MSGPASSKGGTLKIGQGDGPPETFLEIPNIKDVNAPSVQMGTLDATVLKSTAKQVVVDIPDYGEVTFTLLWDGQNSRHQQLVTDALAGTHRNFQLTANDAITTNPTTYAFAAVITKPPMPKLNTGNILTADVTLKLDGSVLTVSVPS